MKIKQAAVLTWQRPGAPGTGMAHCIGVCYAEALGRVVDLDVIVVPVVGENINLAVITKGSVVFPVAPGIDNSGRVQRHLEAAGLAFVGGGSRACELAYGARRLRQALLQAGISVAPFLACGRTDDRQETAAAALRAYPAGCLIRADSGDALAPSIHASSFAEVALALDEVLGTAESAVVEGVSNGRVFSLTCIGREPHNRAVALPIIEVIESGSTETTLYQPGDTEYVRPDDLDSATQTEFERIAMTVLSVVPTPLLRVPVLLDQSGAVLVQAADVSPLLLPSGLVAIAAGNAGWSFSDLVWQAIDSACHRASMGSA